MRRSFLGLGIGVLVALLFAIVSAVTQRLDREREYRRLLSLGEQALQSGDSFGAVEAFSGALAFRPDSMVAHLRRGEAYRGQRRDDEAVRDLREAIRLAPDAPQPRIALGELYDLRGDPAQAASWYSEAAELLRDEDPALLYQLALARYRAGSPAAAKDPLRRLVARNDSIAEAHYLLGLVCRDSQDMEGAINALEQAVRISPSLTAAREELADLYRTVGRHADEMAQLRALVGVDKNLDRRVAVALAEARGGRFDVALTELSARATERPHDSRIYLALGRVYLARAERMLDVVSVTRALQVLEKALGGTAPRSEGLALFGRALYLSGDAAGAERILREAVATSPVSLEAFTFLADAAERLSHDFVAREALVNLDALQGDTISADVRAARARRIGTLSLRLGDSRAAAAYLAQAVAAGPAGADTLALLARARWDIGDAAGAKDALAKGLALEPRHSELLRLSRRIR